MRPPNVQPKYDGITAAGLDAIEEREAIYARDRGICHTCRQPVPFGDFQLAHRIAKTKANYRRFGRSIVDHPLNRVVTHPGRCNDGANCGGNPGRCADIVRQIENTLGGLDK
jgi:ferredoxin